jgi:protein-S-isoprenylcysteine O-methyltransferase Ste14
VLFLLGLLLTVKPVWNLLGVPFLLLGNGLRAWAAGYIHKDRHLTTTGPYAFCRHPLYLGTFLSMVGICLLIGSWRAGVIFTLIFIAVYIPTIRQEETFMARAYGESYNEYKSKVPAFSPKIRMAKAEDFRNWRWKRLLLNEEHLTWAALIIFFLLAFFLKR